MHPVPSLLNGLSSLGSGVSSFAGQAGQQVIQQQGAEALQAGQQTFQTGLVNQKAALDAQAAQLADSLATARESAGRVQSGQIAATAAQTLAGTEAAARAQTAALQAAAPTDQIKLLRALGVLPAGGSALPSAPSNTAGTISPDNSTSPATGDVPTIGPSASTTTPPGQSSGDLPPIAQKMLGMGVPGSDEAIRMAIANDVKTSPTTKYLPAGQQAAEVERQLAIAKGTYIDPATQDLTAKAIANYQMAPPSGQAASRAGAAETMAKVMQLNPGYQPGRFDEVKKAMSDFGTGEQGDKIRFLDTGVQHLGVLDQAADALNNRDGVAWNEAANAIQKQFGVSAPNTFDGLKQIVSTEIEKAVAGGIGSTGDRENLMDSLKSANSPGQLRDMLNGYRSLMSGQLSGLQQQFEHSTGIKNGEFAFNAMLRPETLDALKSAPSKGGGTIPLPPEPSTMSDSARTVAGFAAGGPLGAAAAAAGPAIVRGVQSLLPSGGQSAPPAPVVPTWVKPGDQYSPSRGMARGADGKVYGAPAQ